MKETVTDYETVEREREVVVCDVCGQREEDDDATVEVAFGVTLDYPSQRLLVDELMCHSFEVDRTLPGTVVKTDRHSSFDRMPTVDHRAVGLAAVEEKVRRHVKQTSIEADVTRDVCRRCLTIFEASDVGDSDRITVNEATGSDVVRVPEAAGSSSLTADGVSWLAVAFTLAWVGLIGAELIGILPRVVLPVAAFVIGLATAFISLSMA